MTDDDKKKKEKPKIEKVLEHLQTRGSISQEEARLYYYSWRLSDIIFKLKKRGHNIETTPEEHNGGIHARYVYHCSEEETGQ